jgi:hypothetical protein
VEAQKAASTLREETSCPCVTVTLRRQERAKEQKHMAVLCEPCPCSRGFKWLPEGAERVMREERPKEDQVLT